MQKQDGENQLGELRNSIKQSVKGALTIQAVADSDCLKGRGEKRKRAHSGQHGAPPADTVAFLT